MAQSTGLVKAGFFSFTEITDPSRHRAYNEWHQLDHMPEQLPIPGVVYGQRWVRSPRCVAATATALAPFNSVHYLTAYVMSEPLIETLDIFYSLGRELALVGRFFDSRRSHFARPLRVRTQAVAPRIRISSAAVPYRPHTGIYVTVETLTSSGPSDSEPNEHVETLCTVDGVAGAWTFSSDDTLANSHWDVGKFELTIAWIDGSVLETTARITAMLKTSHKRRNATTLFSGPMETITPWQWDWFDENS